MTDHQENKLSMGNATHEVCRKNETLVNTLPVLKEEFDKLGVNLNSIKTARAIQGTNTKGIAQDKQFTEKAMIGETVKLASAISVYGRKANNNELLSRVKVTSSDLNKMRDADCVDKCRIVYHAGTQLVEDLAPYGITQENINNLNFLIGEYDAQITAPREAITDKTAATAKLEGLFEDMDGILKNMDDLMLQFETSQPDFYNSYSTARKIIDL